MKDPKIKDDTPNTLSNRDTIDLPDDASLSESDPEESVEAFSRKVEELSSSSDEEVVQPASQVSESSSFRLAGGSLGFSYRSRNIFDQLDGAVKLNSTPLAEDNIMDGTFARPAPPSPPQSAPMKSGEPDKTKKASSAKKVPDYLIHPERWTCYNLDDTPETSDRQNSQVALQFIQGLRDRKRSLDAGADSFSPNFNQGLSSSSEHKIIFSKPSQASKDEGPSPQKLERAKVKELDLIHLDAGQDEEEDRKTASAQPEHDRKEKRQRMSEEKDDQEKERAGDPTFHSGKKVNRKNFRKAVEEEDEG
ncbi:U5 small nuclear ribonucleoprotein TSSC4 [Trichomycterus rosablanca]|uniref:U5 small nuclear ribonucleoprotein TSSC4 n=1 Tax=Trichomycterus rosablanca TaxID=2290929 RepID=UPI002F356C2E